MAIALPIFGLFGLLIVGVPVGFALLLSGGLGILLTNSFGMLEGILQTSPHASTASFTLTSIPMFILMAEFARITGITEKAFNACNRWIGHLPGGLGIATVIASTGLAAISGSSTAAAATMAKTATGEMRKFNYNTQFATGIVAVSGTLAVMIPPSIILIVYGILTEVPIGQLLIAGIIPGIITAIGYVISVLVWVKLRPQDAPRAQKYTMKERMESTKGLIPMIILIVFMIVAIYTGIVTPTEAGAVGAFFTLLIGFVMRSVTKKGIIEALMRTAQSTCMIFTIIIGAMVFSYYITTAQLTQRLITFVSEMNVSAWVIMAIIVLIYIILGAFLDQLAILFLTLPLTFPVAMALGFNPIWFGIIVTKAAEIGLITPPLGMNVFITANSAKVPANEVFKGATKLLVVEFIILIILFALPSISTWLPNLMG